MPQGKTAHLILSGFLKHLRGIQKRQDEGPHTLCSPFSSIQLSKKNDLLQAGELYFGFNILESYIKFYVPTQFHKKEKAWDLYKKKSKTPMTKI